jgi:Hydrazine synthase alpha subunit middle domain
MMKRLFISSLLALCGFWLAAQTLPYPILFCTQVPQPVPFATSLATFGNHTASVKSAPRGGDLYIRYPNGTLKNLTQAAGYGENGQQGVNGIAVRDPSIHWEGNKALFSMVVGAVPQRYQVVNFVWKIYEITGLGENQTPVITLVPNQPTGYNNIQPIYGTDERIIFASDRPLGSAAHLFPQHDEYESDPIVSGLWRFDPKTCSGVSTVEMLTHSPSGDFNPIIDRAGRVIFTRWDHLIRDQQADADINGTRNFGTFNYSDETVNATKYARLPDIEVFPEPRLGRNDLFSLPEWANTNPNAFNIFNPWMMDEDGTELEMLNHLGRHDMHHYILPNFTNDPNLHDIYGPSTTTINAMFQIQESPVTPGLYFGTEAGEFGSHASGMIMSVNAPPGMHPEQITFTHITHPDTRSPTSTPSANHTGLYRNPVPLSDGNIVVMHSHETDYDANIGTYEAPLSKYDFRLRLLVADGAYFKASATALTGAGISKTVTWWSPDAMQTYSGLLWETYPVEVRPRIRPTTPTVNVETVEPTEKALFVAAGVNLKDFKKFLRRNNMAVLATRDVTSRDDADQQQPFNLKVSGSTHQTVNPNNPTGTVYEVKHLQYLQADMLRGIGGEATPKPGRRALSRFLHDPTSMAYNPPTTGAQGSANVHPDGSVAAFVPANRALTWQLTDANNKGIVRERLWLSAVPGEIRTCSSCHGESTLNQAGQTSPTNAPQALSTLLNWVKVIDRDNDGIKDIYDAFPTDATKNIAEAVNEQFITNLTNWANQNPNADAATWTTASTPTYANAAMINNRAVDNTGKSDFLRRFVDLSNMDFAKLTFDVAYARYDAVKFDRLKVWAISCTDVQTLVYDKQGSVLATAPDQTTLFTPANATEWRTETLNLSDYIGKTVELVFEDVGGFGNRLFIDNVLIQETDVGIPLAAKAILQGAYNTATGLMNDNLRTTQLIPTTEPYTGMTGFTHIGGGGGETLKSNLLTGTSDNNSIVDWVFLELRDKANSATVLATRSALIQRDGDIVDVDGVSPVAFKIANDNYFVAVRHRNHLGVMTPSVFSINKSLPITYDFSTAANQALNGIQKDLTGGKFGLYAGNINGDKSIRTSGPANVNDYLKLISLIGNTSIILTNVYNAADVNMDGIARASGPATINDYLKLINVLSGLSLITQPF